MRGGAMSPEFRGQLSPVSSGVQGQLSKASEGQGRQISIRMVPIAPYGPQAMDINRDLICSRTMDPEMTLGSSSGPDVTVAPVAAQVTRSV